MATDHVADIRLVDLTKRFDDVVAVDNLSLEIERGLICRADDRGDPVIQISPPLIATQAEFDEITGILGDVLTEAQEQLHLTAPRGDDAMLREAGTRLP